MRYFIDTGKLIININKLRIQLKEYEKIIFDLDDTIFPLFFYDKIVFKKLANLLKKKFRLDSKVIFNFLIEHKYKKKNNNRLFYSLIKNFKLQSSISENDLVDFYQNFKSRKYQKFPTIINLLKELKLKKKILTLITEGHYNRQRNKIEFLKINSLFDQIFILDNRYKRKYKPSIEGLKRISNYKKFKTVYVGDTEKDRLTAKNLGIKFYKFNISKYLYEKK